MNGLWIHAFLLLPIATMDRAQSETAWTKDQEGTPVRKQQLVYGCDILPDTVCLAELGSSDKLEPLLCWPSRANN